MAKLAAHRSATLPPYRVSPESPRLIVAIILATLLLPLTMGSMFFGFRVFYIVLLAAATAWAAENLANAVRMYRQPGSTTHSVLMAVVFAMMLPATVSWYIPVLGAAATVLIGKHVFGGMGHYVWHPALIGRVVAQLFFHSQLTGKEGSLLTQAAMFTGNVQQRLPIAKWLSFDWFRSAASDQSGFVIAEPMNLLRHFQGLTLSDDGVDLARYLAEQLPSLQHCVIGAAPGGLGMTSALALMISGLYLVYRGYLRWQLPVCFLAAVYVSALLFPVVVSSGNAATTVMHSPILSQHAAVSFTYAHYHLFAGGTFLAAFILMADMTSRPITISGQMFFAVAAGILTIIFRLYTPIAVPACAAVLVMNTLVGPIDRFTRPKGR